MYFNDQQIIYKIKVLYFKITFNWLIIINFNSWIRNKINKKRWKFIL